MSGKISFPQFLIASVAFALLLAIVSPLKAEILNDDEFGSVEIIDSSVIENASAMFIPAGLLFNIQRGGPMYPGETLKILYHGMHDTYATVLDYSPDRIVKPLVRNDKTKLGENGLDHEYDGVIGESLGKEYIMLIVSSLPLTDEQLEGFALAPDKIELNDNILQVAVSDFTVVKPLATGSLPNNGTNSGPINILPQTRNDMFIQLNDIAIPIDYPLNTYPYDPWPYMYLYPYPIFNPVQYVERYGPFTRRWYVFPESQTLKSNFFDYAWAGWLDNGRFVIPPGGYWQGTLNVDDPYTQYYLRVLPYLIRENTSYANLQIQINGTLVKPGIDITGAIGWGQYWTKDPFSYYTLANLLHQGDNSIRLYWPQDEKENLELQMLDIVPTEEVQSELDAAKQDESALQDEGTVQDENTTQDDNSSQDEGGFKSN